MDVCPICGNRDLVVQGSYRGSHTIFKKLQRGSCLTCGLVFASPMPIESALEQFNSSYFSTAHGDQPPSASGVAFFSGIARLRLQYIQQYLTKNNIAVSRLLELGPGPGFFARAWLETSPATEYLARETDTSCHAGLQGLGVKLIDRVPLEAGGALDMVVMSHVLEHVPHPTRFLADATRSLRDGGALFIEVPCRDHEHKLFDEPHLLFFDKKPMEHLLHEGGFENIVTSYHGVSIRNLRAPSKMRNMFSIIRSRLIAIGLVAPFGRQRKGMEALSEIERAVLAPFDAHLESQHPSWWLRAVATKKRDE